MEFAQKLESLAVKIRNQASSIGTEEATKNAFVMPFISTILGYDVFDPLEVVPEFTADVGVKRGEKIDYAIMRDGEVQILIECKVSTGQLKVEHASQLFRYFGTTNARVAVLTNGVVWQFFTDLDNANRMDSKPFLVLDLLDVDESLIDEVQKLSKDTFDLDSIISAAEELKYVGALKREIAAQFRVPSDDWIRFFATRVYDGSYTAKVREHFASLVPKASAQFLTEQVNDRLKTALGAGTRIPLGTATDAMASEPIVEADLDRDTELVTTLEELEGYQIVKAIACSEVKPQRVTHRDAKSYFAVLIDDNNRKPVARLHFNSPKQKYLGVLDEAKNETRHPIATLDEIYEHADAIREAVRRYS